MRPGWSCMSVLEIWSEIEKTIDSLQKCAADNNRLI
jgi:hypothetical protein